MHMNTLVILPLIVSFNLLIKTYISCNYLFSSKGKNKKKKYNSTKIQILYVFFKIIYILTWLFDEWSDEIIKRSAITL